MRCAAEPCRPHQWNVELRHVTFGFFAPLVATPIGRTLPLFASTSHQCGHES